MLKKLRHLTIVSLANQNKVSYEFNACQVYVQIINIYEDASGLCAKFLMYIYIFFFFFFVFGQARYLSLRVQS